MAVALALLPAPAAPVGLPPVQAALAVRPPAHAASAFGVAGGVPATSFAEPGQELLSEIVRARLGQSLGSPAVAQAADAELTAWGATHPHGADPAMFAHALAREARILGVETSMATGGSSAPTDRGPAADGPQTTQAVQGTMRLLVLAVEFAGTDQAVGLSHPRSMVDRTCVTETLTLTGPLHGSVPPPGPRDNNTLWIPDFGPDYYRRIIFDPAGFTERVRPDLVDQDDGLPGIDISGVSLQSFYGEASGGRVTFDPGPAGIVAWIQLPHSEAWYGASVCSGGVAPDIADMTGLPGNPRRGFGPEQLVVDAVDSLNASRPDFPWSAYDMDGDAAVDHVLVFHAGKDKSNGGGAEGWQAIWAHRNSLDAGCGGYVVDDGGTPDDRSDDVRITAYTMQYEDAEPGVIIHEFGHELGLPDLYDVTRSGAASSEPWDVMGAGSRSGKLNSVAPARLSTWSRMVLGWAQPTVVTPTEQAVELVLGQAEAAGAGAADGILVNLPPTPVARSGPGWQSTDGVEYVPRYYLLEWRSGQGFDSGLRYTYNTVYAGLTADGAAERQVDYVPCNVPGMVVWLRDLRFLTVNSVLDDDRLLAGESEGPKGGLLVVDSHPEPLRGPPAGGLTTVDPWSGERLGSFAFPPNDDWGGRVQATNAAFGLDALPAITLTTSSLASNPATAVYTATRYGPQPGEPAFHDSLGYYPGVEQLAAPVLVQASRGQVRWKAYALADADASVVVPASGYYAPRTPTGFTGLGGETSPPSADVSTDETLYLVGDALRWMSIGSAGGMDVRGARSGNPGSTDVQFGYHAEVTGHTADGSAATVRLWRSRHELVLAGAVRADASPGAWRVEATVRNVGTRTDVGLYSSLGSGVLVPGTVTGGGIPVAAEWRAAVAAVRAGGRRALVAMEVPAERASAVIWSPEDTDTGSELAQTYVVRSVPPGGAPKIEAVAFTSEIVRGWPAGRQSLTVFLPRADR